jgi:subtilase-type serine protease
VIGLLPDDYVKLFGAGIVNAGKAVRGPGYFDANRLENGDKRTYDTDDYAMYPVDTQGYDSVWSNDIDEIRVTLTTSDDFTDLLENLPVGLLKQGAGRLYLTGENIYQGPTVVAGGEISLGIRGQSDGAAKLAGDVYVEPAGIFSGNGFVDGSLDSSGTISPGLIETPGSVLTVRENVRSSGLLRIAVWNTGQANLLRVDGTADIEGTVVELSGMQGGALPASAYEILRATTLLGSPAASSARTQQGVTLLHTFGLLAGTNTLRAVYAGSEVLPQSKALSEGFLAGAALVNLGADLVAGQGMAAYGTTPVRMWT